MLYLYIYIVYTKTQTLTTSTSSPRLVLERSSSLCSGRMYVRDFPPKSRKFFGDVMAADDSGSNSRELGRHLHSWYPPPSRNFGKVVNRISRNSSALQSTVLKTIFFSPRPALNNASFSRAVVGIVCLSTWDRQTKWCVQVEDRLLSGCSKFWESLGFFWRNSRLISSAIRFLDLSWLLLLTPPLMRRRFASTRSALSSTVSSVNNYISTVTYNPTHRHLLGHALTQLWACMHDIIKPIKQVW